MSDINVQPVNLLKNIDLPQRKKPRNRSNYGSGALRDLSAISKILHHTAFRHCRNCRSWFRNIGDAALGGEEHAGY